MKNTIIKQSYALIGAIILLVVGITGCKREHMTLTTTSDVNITGYFDLYPEQFSLFTDIIKRSGTAGYLGAYGTYTIFAPNNEAVTVWLKAQNKTSVSEVEVSALKDLIKYHLILDTISTAKFTDGKLPLNQYGQYMLTGASNTGGSTKYTINKQALILKPNIRTGNGIIHVLDHVLLPANLTVAKTIEGDSRYSIFTAALKATGFYDTLNTVNNIDTTRRFVTAFAQSDSALRVAGFTSYEQLRAKLSTKNDPKNHADSLWLYVAYHVVPGANYMADLVTTESFATLAPSEVISTLKNGQDVLINEVTFNGVTEPGVKLIRSRSNVTASNGVVNDASQFYKIKVRLPEAVYFDLGDQPELRAKVGFWRVAGKTILFATTSTSSICAGINFNSATATSGHNYYADAGLASQARIYAYNDLLNVQLGTSAARQQWVQFKTPMVVKGKYKIWLCYAQTGAVVCQATVDAGTPDEQALPNLFNSGSYLSAAGVALTDDVKSNPLLLAQGYKRYSTQVATTNANMVGRLLGTADIKTTGYHTIRLSVISGGGSSAGVALDMIHLIPIDDSQNGCRFNATGKVCGF